MRPYCGVAGGVGDEGVEGMGARIGGSPAGGVAWPVAVTGDWSALGGTGAFTAADGSGTLGLAVAASAGAGVVASAAAWARTWRLEVRAL